jgi:hypothetical protein
MADETYVTNGAWVRQVGRPDLIDDVADQYERPAPAQGMESFWSRYEATRWPRSSAGWRSMDRLHARTVERRAG